MDFTHEIHFPQEAEFARDEHFNIRTHNGFVAVNSQQTGRRKVFHISTKRGSVSRFVSILVGTEPKLHEAWRTFGLVLTDGVHVFKKLHTDTSLYRLADVLNRPEHFSGLGFEYLYAGRCRACNRPLLCRESRREGIGPECKKHEAAQKGEAGASHARTPESHPTYNIE